jgi:large subunit ribosomal protein L4
MLNVKVYNLEGKELEEIKLDPKLFNIEINPALIHQVVLALQANARQKLAHTKTRAEVRGGGKKPWRQKGTGRARHGSIRSPLWVGGGITFGPRKEREFGQKINKKMKRKAVLMALSDKVKENNFIVVDRLDLAKIMTKDLVKILNNLPIKSSQALLVLAKKNETISKSARNLPKIKTVLADSLNLIDIIKFNYLLIDKDGLDKIAETYKD